MTAKIINFWTLYQERQLKHSEEWTHTEDTALCMFMCIFYSVRKDGEENHDVKYPN